VKAIESLNKALAISPLDRRCLTVRTPACPPPSLSSHSAAFGHLNTVMQMILFALASSGADACIPHWDGALDLRTSAGPRPKSFRQHIW